MSTDAQKAMRARLRALMAADIPGGCDDCDAYQRMIEESEGVFTLRVFHDDTCPFLRAWEQR